jgi:hypothetical protein
LLAAAPELALTRLAVGATRHGAEGYFLDEIDHHVYAGDAALHIVAAAYEADLTSWSTLARSSPLIDVAPSRFTTP